MKDMQYVVIISLIQFVIPNIAFTLFDPVVTAIRNDEFLIDTCMVYNSAYGSQVTRGTASDSTLFFIVWEDSRNEPADIYGARVNLAGAVLDPGNIPICCADGYQTQPAIAWGGGLYLVVWQDLRSSENDIYAARITQDGTVLDSLGFPISLATGYQFSPVVAYGADNFFVVWGDERNGISDIYAARITPDGTVLDTNGIVVSNAVGSQSDPGVVYNGEDFFLVWQDMRGASTDIYAARVNQAGVVLDTAGIAISTATSAQCLPEVAFDGANQLVVWHDYRVNPPDIYAARITPGGTVLDTSGIAVAAQSSYQRYPSVAFNGVDYLVSWEDMRDGIYDIYAARVNTQGILLDTNSVAVCSAIDNQYYAQVTSCSTKCLVAWADLRSGYDYDAYAARVDTQGIVLDPDGIILGSAANTQRLTAVCFDGSNYLCVWQDDRSIGAGLGSDLYSMRVSGQGQVIDSAAQIMSTALHDQRNCAVSFDTANYFIVWADERDDANADIYGARVNTAGTVLDTSGILISATPEHQWSPDISFGNNNHVVVWSDDRNGLFDIYAARVAPDGVVLDTNGIVVTAATDDQKFPDVIFGTDTYLAVWQDYRSQPADIYAARITPGGVVLDTSGILISTDEHWQWYPAVGFDGLNFMVVWQDMRSGECDIYAARIAQDGTVLDPGGIPICISQEDQVIPVIEFDGNDYLVAWKDYRNGVPDIYACQVNRSGLVVSNFILTHQPGIQEWPALAYGLDGNFLTIYSGWADTVNGHHANTMRAWGILYSFPGVADHGSYLNRAFMTARPNPFTRSIKFTVNRTGFDVGTAVIYDCAGRVVRNLSKSVVQGVQVDYIWDGADNENGMVPAGIYFVELGHGPIQKIIKVR